MSTLKKLLSLLTKQERKRLILLIGMTMIMALLDMVGMASIMPFMSVLANPQLVESNFFLNTAYKTLDFVDPTTFLFFLGLVAFTLLIVSLTFKAFYIYLQTCFALLCEYSIGKRLVEGYLHQPYSWFLNRHSAELGKTILSEVSVVIATGIMPLLTLIAQVVVTITLMILLLVVDPLLAFSVFLLVGFAYGIIFTVTRGWLKQLGGARISANQERYTVISEAFSASKEVKVGGLENVYIQRFATPAKKFAVTQAKAQLIAQLPRYILEAIAFGGMLVVMLYLMVQSGGFANALPIVALYAFVGYRLMPALQQIYGAVTYLRFAGPAINTLHADLIGLQRIDSNDINLQPISLTQTITLNNIVYSYPNTSEPVLSGIDFAIPARSTIALVGSTGSGKTTIVDIILGLLDPQEGSLKIDGQLLTDINRRQWQSTIGYVPQQIFLADDTVAANIAFGVSINEVNQRAVERAAKIANLHDFVITSLPQGYKTKVGERGVRLSGGQRQRIGIARALYHNPQVLILYEATSALDGLTEQAVMEAVSNLGQEITIILIAHRLSTVRQCHRIYVLESGKVKAAGTYEELIASNPYFATMANRN
jgi:ABC-type multidrug transport system fused ATPase/permease subunit